MVVVVYCNTNNNMYQLYAPVQCEWQCSNLCLVQLNDLLRGLKQWELEVQVKFQLL